MYFIFMQTSKISSYLSSCSEFLTNPAHDPTTALYTHLKSDYDKPTRINIVSLLFGLSAAVLVFMEIYFNLSIVNVQTDIL